MSARRAVGESVCKSPYSVEVGAWSVHCVVYSWTCRWRWRSQWSSVTRGRSWKPAVVRRPSGKARWILPSSSVESRSCLSVPTTAASAPVTIPCLSTLCDHAAAWNTWKTRTISTPTCSLGVIRLISWPGHPNIYQVPLSVTKNSVLA